MELPPSVGIVVGSGRMPVNNPTAGRALFTLKTVL